MSDFLLMQGTAGMANKASIQSAQEGSATLPGTPAFPRERNRYNTTASSVIQDPDFTRVR
jgi:hypothetical protein